MELYEIAAKVLREYGVDFASAVRAGGWTNMVLLADDFALRLAIERDTGRIRREVALSRKLPEAVGYPENVATGVEDGYEWSLSRRVDGVNLSEAWDSLDTGGRISALKQVFDICAAVRSVDVDEVEALVLRRCWFSTLDPIDSRASIEGVVRRGALSEAQAERIWALLSPFYAALEAAPKVLCHGDVTMDNMLWQSGRVASLMDFEHALLAPAQFDLYSILLPVFDPLGDAARDTRLVEAAVSAARPLLASEADAQLLIGFALLHSLRHMELWLDNPGDGKTPAQSWPYASLTSLSGGDGGHFAPVIRHLI